MKLLLSLCNGPAHGPLCEYDTETGEANGIRIDHPSVAGANGATGLAFYRDGFLLALQSPESFIVHLSPKYEVIGIWALSSVQEAHSIAVRDDAAYIASTGTNAVVRFEDGKETVFWSADGSGGEHIHLNCLAWHDDRLHATAFGVKSGELWSSAREGYLLDLETGVPIMDSLYHPHSVVSTDDGMMVCESSRQRVACESGEVLPVGAGYARGLAVTPDEIIVGVSRGRVRSRSSGVIVDNPADPGALTDWCGIRRYARGDGGIANSTLRDSVCLSDFGNEIYDILVL